MSDDEIRNDGEPRPDGNIVDINRWRDFNDAEPQRLDDAWPAHAVQSTDEIKARMLVHIRGVLSYLFPGGVFQRGNFFVGDIRGNPGDSLNVEIEGRKAGMWHDFATGEGGDIIGLWAAAIGRDTKTEFPAIVADILAWLDGRPRTLHDERAGGPRRKTPSVDELGPVTAKWDYLDDDGRLIACVYRYDPPGGKQFRPWDVLARKKKAPDPRPLYNRPGIKAAADVILVDATPRLRECRRTEQDLMDAFVDAIARAAGNGHPFTHTGGPGLYLQRHRLPAVFHDMGRKRLQDMAQELLNRRPPVLVKGMASGSKEDKWLDVPTGPFARGVGEFVHGADEAGE